MNDLEKIFLGVVILCSLTVLFMLSLYFDIGYIFSGGLMNKARIAGGTLENLLDETREEGLAEKIKSENRGSRIHSSFQSPSCRSQRNRERTTIEQLIERKRKRLRKENYSSPEYIELEFMTIRDADTARQALKQCKEFYDKSEFEYATRIIRTAIGEVEPKSLRVLLELFELWKKCLLAQWKLEEAETVSLRIVDMKFKIYEIEAKEPQLVEIAKRAGIEIRPILSIQAKNEQKKQVKTAFLDLRQSKDGYKEDTKDRYEEGESDGACQECSSDDLEKRKSDVLEAFKAGEINEEDKNSILEYLDSLKKKKAQETSEP